MSTGGPVRDEMYGFVVLNSLVKPRGFGCDCDCLSCSFIKCIQTKELRLSVKVKRVRVLYSDICLCSAIRHVYEILRNVLLAEIKRDRAPLHVQIRSRCCLGERPSPVPYYSDRESS